MSGKNITTKTLLVHEDSTTKKATGIIVEEKEVVQKTKEFLEKIAKKYKQAKVNMYAPLGVVVKSEHDEEGYAVAYEKEKFVIVVPNGTKESAKLYGNWNEALVSVQRILTGAGANKSSRFLLAQYEQESK